MQKKTRDTLLGLTAMVGFIGFGFYGAVLWKKHPIAGFALIGGGAAALTTKALSAVLPAETPNLNS